MSGTENFFQRFLSIFSGKVITTITAIVSTPIIVRLLGPGGYGNYVVLLSLFSLYMIPVSSGITEGVQKFIAERREISNWQENVIQFYGLLAIGLVLVAVVLLLAATVLGIPEAAFGEEFTLYFYLLAVFVFIAQFREVSIRIVLGFGLEPISETLKVLKKLVTVLLGIGLVAVGYGVSGMLAGHIAASLLVAIGAGYVIARKIDVRVLFGRLPSSFPYRELISFNVLNIVLILLVMSLFHVDRIMVRTFIDSETTGYYAAALALAEYIWFVPLVLQTLLLHSSSTLWSEGRTEMITDLASRITRYSVLLVVLMAVGLGALADRFVPLYYGEPFTVSVLPLLLLLPGAVGFAAARPLQAICQGSGRLKTLIVATAGGAGLNIVLNAVFIPQFGMNGAAVATSISYGSMFVFFVWAARKIGFDPLDDFRASRIAATVIVSAPLIVLLERAIASDVLAFLIVPPVGALVYCTAAIATGALDVEELVEILGKFPGPVDSAIERVLSWIPTGENRAP